MKNRSRDTAGLSLPEVLLATVIIMIAILGIVGLFPTALTNGTGTYEVKVASTGRVRVCKGTCP